MFCPLCESEFRDGFTTSSDCGVPLVSSRNAAQASRTRFWKGASQGKYDRLLRALDAAGIPFHQKEIVNLGPRFSIMGIPIGRHPSTFEYEIWIFRGDKERAVAATKDIEI